MLHGVPPHGASGPRRGLRAFATIRANPSIRSAEVTPCPLSRPPHPTSAPPSTDRGRASSSTGPPAGLPRTARRPASGSPQSSRTTRPPQRSRRRLGRSSPRGSSGLVPRFACHSSRAPPSGRPTVRRPDPRRIPDDRPRRHQRFRPHRPPVAQGAASSARPDVEVVAVNDLVDVPTNALLFKHDSTYGAYPGEVEPHRRRDRHRRQARSRSSRSRTRRSCRGATSASTSCIESTGLFTDADEGPRPHRRGREEGDHQRPGQGRGHHDRAGRQRGQVRPATAPRSSATRAARRTASRRRPRSSTTSSTSSAA